MPGNGGALKTENIVRFATQALSDRKCEDMVLLDVRGLSNVTDYYIIVSGNSAPHLKAMFDEVQQALKKKRIMSYRKSGDPESGWLVLDYLDFVIHIFARETRDYYAIEKLWEQAPRLDTQES